jgi:hypothetical protein
MNEPPTPTLGTLQAIARDFEKSEGKTGMEYVIARLRALNGHYCWTPGLRNKPKTNWEQVNRHLWRIKALYHGGDCFLAGWEGAIPNQRLYPSRGFVGDDMVDGVKVRKVRFGASITGYRPPKVT